jgi:hypothetical protein
MWQLIAIVLIAIIWFYLGAIYLTVVAWLNTIGHLLQGNFIRAAAWFSIGSGMIFWWTGSGTIPEPMDFDQWLHGSAVIVGIGALATFARFCHRHRAAQTDAPLEAAPMVTFTINAEPPVIEHTPRRRLPRPTVINQ